MGRSVGLKKKKKNRKKNHKKSRNRRSSHPRMTLKVNIYIFGLRNAQYTVKKFPVFVPVFLYTVTMLIFQIKRIVSSEKWFNYVVTSSSSSSFFFLKMPKIWVGRTTLNVKRRKKRGWPKYNYAFNIFSRSLR